MKVLLLALFVAAASAAPSAKSSLLPPHLLAIAHQIAADPVFIQLARASDSYKCMVAAGVTPSLSWLLEQGHAAVLTNANVQKCVQDGGGLVHILSTSAAVQYAYTQALAQNVNQQVGQIIVSVFGEQQGAAIIAAIQSNRPSRIASSKGLLPPHLLAIAQQIAADPEFIRLARASDSYKCMVAAGVTPSLNWLLEQGAAAIITNSNVLNCVQNGGGLVHILSTSEAVQYAYAQALAQGVNQQVGQIIVAVFGPGKGQEIIAAIQSNRPSRQASSKGLLPPHLLAIAQQIAADPEFIRLARASDSYKCMVAAGVTPSLNWLLEQGAAAVVTNSDVRKCVQNGGGLVHILSTSEAVQYAYTQALAQGVNQQVGEIIVGFFGEQQGAAIISAIQSNRP